MTIAQAYQTAYNESDFRARVEFFIVKAAIAVTTESVEIANHAARFALAQSIFGTQATYVTRFALAALTNPSLLASAAHTDITDNDLEFTINSIFDSFV